MDKDHLVSQAIAVLCILSGALICAWGCYHGQQWEALKTLGAGITGAGIQAFTSQFKQQLTNQGTMNVSPDSKP